MSKDSEVNLSQCNAARSVLISYVQRPHNQMVLKMALDDMIEVEDGCLDDDDAENAARHVASCSACQSWLDEFYPDRAQHRDKLKVRQKTYCCSSMWAAIHDTEVQTRFHFLYFRGEDPCWCINDDFSFASFCPWCGQALPEGPFEEADKTSCA